MSSGGKSRINKGSKSGTDRSGGGGTKHSHQGKSDHNHNEKEKDSIPHKNTPTAEQLRIAQMIDNTHSEKVLQEKINQVMQVTGVSTDDAIVALHDCDNDVNAAIDSLLEGEDQGEWRESTKKKKKAPATKSKEEAESNKENRRVENRERGGSRSRGGGSGPPRFRGRGAGRGGREESSEGGGRGSGGRRGRMANGTGPPAGRGRGGRGRGSSSNPRTFQKRQAQPPGFTETIDTWSAIPEKVESTVDDLQIDNWDDEKSTATTTEDWDGEWTGSLDKTTVFSPSTAGCTPSRESNSLVEPVSPPLQDTTISASTNISVGGVIPSGSMNASMSSVLGGQGLTNNATGAMQASLPESVSNVLSLGQQQLSNSSLGATQSYQNVAPSSSSISQSQAIDFAALLQKAAPHSTLGRLSTSPMDSGHLSTSPMDAGGLATPLVMENKNSLLGSISASVGESMKSAGMLSSSNSASSPPSVAQQSYAPAHSVAQQSYASAPSVAQQSYASAPSVVQQSYAAAPSVAQQSYAPAQSVAQQSYAPAQSVAQQSYTPAQSIAQQSYASAPSVAQQSYAPAQSVAQQSYAPAPSVAQQSYSPAQSVTQQSYASAPSVAQQSYAPASSVISNSMFSNSVSGLGNSLTSGNGVGKVLSLSAQQNASLQSRPVKPQNRRLPHSTKIPSQAVEMPEVAMAALDMQFTGLEFGTEESFDFTSDVKSPLMGNALVTGSSVSSREQPSSASKDLSALASTIAQPQSLGPQPIPFPSQSVERKPPQSSLLSGAQRPSAAPAPVQSLTDLTKKESSSSGGGPSLGGLVGSNPPSTHTPYQSSANSGYGPKASAFPSPPAHYSQNPSQNYSSNSSGVSNSGYAGTNASSSGGGPNSSNSNQAGGGYSSSFSAQVSAAAAAAAAAGGQYQNNYVNVSSHSLASMSSTKPPHTALKESPQVQNEFKNYSDSAGNSSSLSGSLSATGGGSSSAQGLSGSLNSATSASVQPSKTSVPGKSVSNLGPSVPPGVQPHSVSQQHLGQHHPTHHHLQQQTQQAQQTQQLMTGPSQYVSPQQAALQGALAPHFYNVQQPAIYPFEDLQVFQQRIPHMAQAPSTLPGGRDAAITSPPSYSVAEANKFRTDQNSSPVPSTISQQGAVPGAAYITAPGNAGMPPLYMYQTMPAVPNTFSQYGAPAILQIPPNTHTGSTSTQFPGPPKIPYGGTSTYYDNISQTQDYKTGYGSGSQGQNKTGQNSSGSASNTASDLTGYKSHLGKINRTYEKQTYHTGTPPPFNLASSGTNPMAANYTPMFISPMPAATQHHSSLMHHQLHQDGGSSAGQRTASGGVQTKGGTKGSYSGSYWAN